LGTGACGGGSSGSPAVSAGSSRPGNSDPRSAAQLAADRKLAQQALLTLSDFPEGWQATPSENDDNNDQFQEQLDKCLDVPESLFGQDTDDSVDSPDFGSPDNQQVSSSVMIGSSTEKAQQVFDILEQANATQCLRDYLDREMRDSMKHESDTPQGMELGKVTFGQVNLPQYADESVAFRATVPVTASGFNADVNVDLVFMRHGRAATFVSFLDIFSPFPVAQEKHYAKIAADRLTALDV
jgi:hypothetical protein